MATATPYGPFLLRQALGAAPVDVVNDPLKVAHFTDTYTPDLDSDEFYADLTGELAAGDGYTLGGETLTSVAALAYNTTDDRAEIDCDNPSWTFTADKTFRYSVYYKDTGDPATAPLIGLIDWGANRVENGVFELEIDAGGFLQFRSVSETV